MPRSTEIVGEKTNSTGLIIHRIIAYVVLVLLVVVSLFPFYLLIINATRGRSQAGITVTLSYSHNAIILQPQGFLPSHGRT